MKIVSFRTGQTVSLNIEVPNRQILVDGKSYSLEGYKLKGPATILYPHKDGGWSVIFKDEETDNLVIDVFFSQDLRPYKSKCWGHDCDGIVNSSVDQTCSQCHWVKCPKCGRCKKHKCVSDRFKVNEAAVMIRPINQL